MLTILEHDRRALRTGLAFAALLQRHFPDLYARHVTREAVTYASLYGAALTFLSKAHGTLVALDLRGQRHTHPKDPAACMHHGRSHGRCQTSLAGEMVTWLDAPAPRVYGLARDLDLLNPYLPARNGGVIAARNLRQMGQHALAVAVWLLLSEGPWARLGTAELRAHAQLFEVHSIDLRRVLLTHANPLTPPTPLRRLCARLDREEPHGVKRLGAIVAYIAARTANPFADRFQEEVGAHGGAAVPISWRQPTASLKELGEQQRAARSLAQAYARLDRRCHSDPDLLNRICNAIRQTAGELLREVDVTQSDRGEPYNPAALLNVLIAHEVLT